MGELVRRVGLAVRLKEESGGMVGVRAGEQESLTCCLPTVKRHLDSRAVSAAIENGNFNFFF
jgi:hypothetical protein